VQEDTILNKLILSQTGVYHLHQLANQLRQITGARYKLSDEASRINMIRDAAASTHKVIQTYLAAFTSALSHQQIELLTRLGIFSPRLAKAS
jgi:hypothetical protein